jgi:hypothetical protein
MCNYRADIPRVTALPVAAQMMLVPRITVGDFVKRWPPLAKLQCQGIGAGLGPMPLDRERRADEPISAIESHGAESRHGDTGLRWRYWPQHRKAPNVDPRDVLHEQSC